MTRLESIKSNAFLLGLNMNKATKEQKIQWLCQIIDNETDKPEDEMDLALIGECSAYLRELSDKTAEATKEQKKRILQQIKAHHNQTATTKSAKVLRPTWRKIGKGVAIAATVAALLLSTLTVLAKVNGYSSAWEYVKENIQRIVGLDAGDRVNAGNITLIKNDGIVTYSSVEELISAEKFDIFYPSQLPDGVRVTNFSQVMMPDDYTIYSVQFTDSAMSITVSNMPRVSFEDMDKHERYKTENILFYIERVSGQFYQAIGHNEGYEYVICCDDYDKLIIVLNGMKGIDK